MAGRETGRLRAQNDWQRLDAVHHHARVMAQLAAGDRQASMREPADHGVESDLCLQPGQGSTEAIVDALAETEVCRVTVDVQPVGMRVLLGVTACAEQRYEHDLPGWDGDAPVADRLLGPSHGCHPDGAVESENLFDCGRDEARVPAERPPGL